MFHRKALQFTRYNFVAYWGKPIGASVHQLRRTKETEGRIWRDHSGFLGGKVIGAALAREEFAEKLDITSSVVFVGLK